MPRYDKFEMDTERYQHSLAVQHQNKSLFREQIHGARKSLYVHGKLVATTASSSYLDLGTLTKDRFAAFIGAFNKKLYGRFIKHPELLDLKIEFRGVSKNKNHKTWDALPAGTWFYNVDLKSAYWQIGHRLGYIEPQMYKRYLLNDEYKQAKRYCISFLARPNKMVFNGPNGRFEIHCDTSPMKRAYDNIRKELYRMITGAIAGITDYIEYNTDGVTVKREHLEQVKAFFTANGLLFKTTICKKVGPNEYLYGKKQRKFKTKLI